jgi:hypothetical protein
LYNPEICSLNITQLFIEEYCLTELVCHSLQKSIGLDFVKDFAKVFQFSSQEPSESFKKDLRLSSNRWNSFFEDVFKKYGSCAKETLISIMKYVALEKRFAYDHIAN